MNKMTKTTYKSLWWANKVIVVVSSLRFNGYQQVDLWYIITTYYTKQWSSTEVAFIICCGILLPCKAQKWHLYTNDWSNYAISVGCPSGQFLFRGFLALFDLKMPIGSRVVTGYQISLVISETVSVTPWRVCMWVPKSRLGHQLSYKMISLWGCVCQWARASN